MPRSPLLAFVLCAAIGCSGGGAADQSATGALKTDSAGGLVVAPSTPYRATDASGPAALVVTLEGGATAAPVQNPPACAAPPASAIETVFWLDGIREGKALPRERRYDLASSNCGLAPRMQGVVVGGAINVFNSAGAHRLVFVRAGTTDTLQTMPFVNDGSLVATDRLTRTPGIVEVRCTAHPKETAYIAVFDHPYFGVAHSGEKVMMDSLPAGDYRLMTWHEGMVAPSAVPARVGASGQTDLVVKNE
jgi:hypothetical protein